MPRRDAINDKKKERLMQEHEQLQKLMLQARSSVRRSSQKEGVPEEQDIINNGDSTNTDPAKTIQDIEPAGIKEQPVEKEKDPDTASHEYRHTTASKPAEQQKTQVNSLHGRSIIVITPPQENNPTFHFEDTKDLNNKISNNAPALHESTNHNLKNDEIFVAPDESRVWEQDELLQAYEQGSIKRRRKARVITYSLLLIVSLLAGFGGYYFYLNASNKNVIATKKTRTVQKTETEKPLKIETGNSSGNESANASETSKSTEKEIEPEEKVAPVKAINNITSSTSIGQYKVLSKAYFHNEPDESTRRKAFITHWNNAVLTPTEEKNGFVYVVFTNHLGQTSKGWLRMKDLQKVN